METDLINYYGRRASEYERIYAKPERQADLGRLRAIVGSAFRDRDVLEISCGTGYWTEVIAPAARSVLACDLSPDVLEIARRKEWHTASVEFLRADSYALPEFGRRYAAAFAGFWWSHVPRRKIGGFLSQLHERLTGRAKVMFIDNRYVEGSSTPIARVDEQGDSFQRRQLSDGSVHDVMKNFPSEDELLRVVAGLTANAEVILTDYYWILSYETK
jgi:demethylmenaquinone methyltransferase/2-methoxy-6-polyprenyl-1,4-benzoquinol methylase